MKYKYTNEQNPEYNMETQKQSLVYEKLAELLNAKYLKKSPWIKKTTVKQRYTHKEIIFYGDRGEKWIFEVDAHF